MVLQGLGAKFRNDGICGRLQVIFFIRNIRLKIAHQA